MTTGKSPFYYYLLTSGRSARTAETYDRNHGIYERWCFAHEISPETAYTEAVQRYLAEELGRISRNTVSLRLYGIKAFYEFIGHPEISKDIHLKREKLAPKAPMESDSLDTLLGACRNDRKAMITVAAECGLRISEVVSIRAQDVDIEGRALLVHGKGAKERWVVLTDRAAIALMPFLATGDVLWLTRYGMPVTAKRAGRNMWEIEKRAQVKAHYHRLRTTFAHRYLTCMHDIDSLQTIMGHADTNTTRAYAAYGAQQRALDQMRRYSQLLSPVDTPV